MRFTKLSQNLNFRTCLKSICLYISHISHNLYLLSERRHTIIIQCYGNHIEVKSIQLYALNWQFKEGPHKKNWVFWEVIFEGLCVQMMPRDALLDKITVKTSCSDTRISQIIKTFLWVGHRHDMANVVPHPSALTSQPTHSKQPLLRGGSTTVTC